MEIEEKSLVLLHLIFSVASIILVIVAVLGFLTHWWSDTALALPIMITGTIGLGLRYFHHLGQTAQQQVRITELENKIIQEPAKASYAWDLARVKLEAYFDRNLNQVKAIFWVAVVVMLAGFGFILWGLRLAMVSPERITVSIIGAASGVVTQFIGLTFMMIYKNTMKQATQYVTVLERINTVGMAVQILDAINEASSELKDVTRVDIIRLLLAGSSVGLSFSPRTRKKKTGEQSDAGETPLG